MTTHADATHKITPDKDPVSGATYCTVCNRDLTADEIAAVAEEAP